MHQQSVPASIYTLVCRIRFHRTAPVDGVGLSLSLYRCHPSMDSVRTHTHTHVLLTCCNFLSLARVLMRYIVIVCQRLPRHFHRFEHGVADAVTAAMAGRQQVSASRDLSAGMHIYMNTAIPCEKLTYRWELQSFLLYYTAHLSVDIFFLFSYS